MTVGEKREFLKKYRILVSRIKRIKEMLESDTERKEKYINDINTARGIRDKIEDMIERVDGGILSEVLFQKYVCGKSIEATALTLNYSKRQIERLHLRALQKLDMVF